MPITRRDKSQLIAGNNAAYKCTLHPYPETETFLISTEVPSTPRTSNAIWIERATRMADFPAAFAGEKWLHFYKNRQFRLWMACMGLIVGALLLVQVGQLIGYWGTELYNDIYYGMPRTTQVDAYVGNEMGKTPSHFIAENVSGQVLIIEFPGGDAQRADVIIGPRILGPHADQIPVQLSFVDLNGNHLPDMVIHLDRQTFWYMNTHGTFVPLQSCSGHYDSA